MGLSVRNAGDSYGKLNVSRRIKLTITSIGDATCPANRERVFYYDTVQPGLALQVTKTGKKAFYLYKKVDGVPQQMCIGSWPSLTIDRARHTIAIEVGKIADGKNPMNERRERKARQQEKQVKGMTLGELWTWFLEKYAKPRKRSWKTDETRYNTHLKPWQNRKIADITGKDVADLQHLTSQAKSQITANRVIALLSAMFNKGKVPLGLTVGNPCEGVEKFVEHSRERFLSGDELQRFFTALETADADWRDFFKTCLFTGARRGNVLTMRWEELNLQAGQWSIPGSKFKNAKPVIVHLTRPALDILNARKGNPSPWVFPGTNSATGHKIKPEPEWRSICKAAKLTDLRIHDLRRTMGSWLASGGTSLQIVGKALGHRSTQSTQIYSRLEASAVGAHVDAATDRIMAAVNAPKPADAG